MTPDALFFAVPAFTVYKWSCILVSYTHCGAYAWAAMYNEY